MIVETAELESKVHVLDGPGRPGANVAGAQATQSVAHSGTWSVMAVAP
ncbi:hypothetical protein ACIA8E_40315 [Streptomyces sp. NPDC051664]